MHIAHNLEAIDRLVAIHGEAVQAVADKIAAQFPRPVRESIHGYAIHKRRVLHFPDVLHGADVPAGLRETAEMIGNYSMIVAPMLWESEGIGAIQWCACRRWRSPTRTSSCSRPSPTRP